MSSDVKAKLIVHFFNCTCCDHDVNHMVKKLKVSQPTLSKHINKLLKKQVLKVTKKGKERFYGINIQWKKQWKKILEPIINHPEYKNCNCSCNRRKNERN